MQRKSLKILGLGALLATAFVAGCPGDSSDGDTIFNYLRGTASAETLDNNWGTDAFPLQRMFVGSNGEVVLSFEQANEYEHGDDGWDFYNYYRVLGAGAGPIREVDWFAQNWSYDQNYNAGAHSYNKRYEVGYNYNNSMSTGWLIAYDSADGVFGKPIVIRDDNSDQLGTINFFAGLMVDNMGIATVLLNAEGDYMTSDGQNDMDELWAIRVDMNTNTIVQDWVIVNRAFNSDSEANDEGQDVSIEDWAIALNGDILIAIDFTDDYDATGTDVYLSTLESIYYDASADTWTQTRIDQVDDAGGDPYNSWGFDELDTDGKSFQIVYDDYSDNTGTEYYLWSARFIAGSASAFPTADIVDLGDGDVTSHYENFYDLTFGRDGSSVITYEMHHFDFGNLWVAAATWSDETTDPSTATSWELLNLDPSTATDDGYSTNDNPVVSFQNDGSGSIVFTAENNDTNVTDEELYIVFFDNTGAGTQANPGTDNIADAEAATGAEEDRFVDFAVSGYSNPFGGVATNVVAFTSEFRDTTPSAEDQIHHIGVVLISDMSYGPVEYIEDNTQYPLESAWLASTNDIKTGGSYNDQLDFFIDPDTLPAVGNGVVWFVWTQVTLVDGDSGQVRPFAWNWNPNTQLGTINDLSRDVLNWDGDTWFIESVNPATSGAASIFLNYMGQSIRCNVNPSASATVAGTTDGGTDVTPVDMAGGDNMFHCDGMSWKWTISATDVVTSTFQGGGFIWSIWEGHDVMSTRVFGKRTR